MIPEKIQALFDFIDFLNSKKAVYIEKFIPLCEELMLLDSKRQKLRPRENYKDKMEYDIVQKEISEKFKPITQEVYIPFVNKLLELGIWSGDETFASIWNNNLSGISDFKNDFTDEDVVQVMNYKQKYLAFRIETNSNFLSLQMVLQDLDEIFKQLFDFFKDTKENEFDSFETKTIEVNSIEEAIKSFIEAKGKNISFTFPDKTSLPNHVNTHAQTGSVIINNEYIMGDKIQTGDISNNNGPVTVGKDIKISDSFNDRSETAGKIAELVTLIKQDQNINEAVKQVLVSDYEKVKDELLEDQPVKAMIFKWLSNIKKASENLIFSHHITEAIHWISRNLNFVL